jgi:hypothetical protein
VKLLKYLFLSSILTSTLAFAQYRYEAPTVDSVVDMAKKVEKLVERHGEMIPASELDRMYHNLNRIVRTFKYFGFDPIVEIPTRVCNSRHMIELDGTLIHTFPSVSACRDAIDRANSGKPMCSQNLMINTFGEIIHRFPFVSSCNENLSYVENGQFFCDGQHLYNSHAERKHTFPFLSDCQSARDQINRN